MSVPPLRRVSRSAVTDRIRAVVPRTLRLPAVRRGPRLSEVEQAAASALHAHLLRAQGVKRTVDEDLAGALERAGCWPLVAPGPTPIRGHEAAAVAAWRWALRRELRAVLVQARATWDSYGPGAKECSACDIPKEGDLCAFHKRQRYDWHDDLAKLARRIVHEIPKLAAEGMREE